LAIGEELKNMKDLKVYEIVKKVPKNTYVISSKMSLQI